MARRKAPLLTVPELADLLGMSADGLYRMIAEDRTPVPVVRIGRSVRFRRVDVDRLLYGEEPEADNAA